MSEESDKIYKENRREFEEEEKLYQAECHLEDTKTVMEGNRLHQDCV